MYAFYTVVIVTQKQTFVSDVAKAFISSNFIGPDLRIDLRSLPTLVLRLQIQLNSHGLNLDTDKFSAMVERNNDVETVLKLCGNMLSVKTSKDTVDPSTIDMVTIDQQKYSKGSVMTARGKSNHLVQPKLEHRNTVVREISRKLSMKGIEILSDSDDDSSIESEFEPESISRESPVRRQRPPARDESSARRQRPAGSGGEKKSKTAGKFKAAAKISRFAGGSKRDDDYEYRRSASQSSGSVPNKTQTKSKFKSAALMTTVSRSKDKRSDDDMSHGGTGSATMRTKVSALKGSMRRGTSVEYDDASISSKGSRTGSSMRTKVSALKGSMRRGTSMEYDDVIGSKSISTTSTSGRSRRTRTEGRDMTPEKRAFSGSSESRRKAKPAVAGRAASMSSQSSGGRRVRSSDPHMRRVRSSESEVESSLSQSSRRSSSHGRVERRATSGSLGTTESRNRRLGSSLRR
eukprot:scaffold18305_cov58-Cyclotella_meneghiniana.AAC.2